MFSGCNGIQHGFFPSVSTDSSLVGSTKPSPTSSDGSALCLPISTRTSLSIDVECILDYVQGTEVLDNSFTPLPDPVNPWFRYQITF